MGCAVEVRVRNASHVQSRGAEPRRKRSFLTTTILVTGVGGGVGQSVIKSLAGSGYRIVGADAEPLAAGLYAVDRGYRLPYASDPAYADCLLDIAKREAAALVFPGLDAELGPLARAASRFVAEGVTPIVSREDVVAIADDKLETARFLSRAGLAAPATFPLAADVLERLSLPIVLKPRVGGARSRGVMVVRDRQELQAALIRIAEHPYVAQEHLDGTELTCSAVTLEGTVHGPIILRRTLRDGDTYKAFVVFDDRITAVVRQAATALQPFGACNFQLRLHHGEPTIFEINARCSGTTHCRTLAGFNEPRMIADYLVHGIPPQHAIRPVSILRYWNELVVDNESIDRLNDLGVVDGAERRL
jgi:carbamoyl-phosphate synthase large subunit